MKVSWKNQKNMSLFYKNEVYDIIGACFDVYKELSCGLSEPIYQEALEIEFNLRGIPFEREKELVVYYIKDENCGRNMLQILSVMMIL